jgi:hypothetical protein
MNNLMVLAGLVLVVCVMNSKDLMKSDLVKSLSSKSKSLKMDNTTMLVLGFVVIVLFICMSKNIEGFKLIEADFDYEEQDPKFNGVCPSNSTMKKINKIADGGGDNVAWGLRPPGISSDPAHPYGANNEDFGYHSPDLNKHLYGCLRENGSRANVDDWNNITSTVIEEGTAVNNSSDYCSSVLDGDSAKICSRFSNSDCRGYWSACNSGCQKTYSVTHEKRGSGSDCEASNGALETCPPGHGDCPLDVNCGGTWSDCTPACEDATQRTFTQTTDQSGKGTACPVAVDCQPGDGACPVNKPCAGSWGPCQTTGLTGAKDCKMWFTPTNSSSGNGTTCAAVARVDRSDAVRFDDSDLFTSGASCVYGESSGCMTHSQEAADILRSLATTFATNAGNNFGNTAAEQLDARLGPALDTAITTLTSDSHQLLTDLTTDLEAYIAMNPKWLAAATKIQAVQTLMNSNNSNNINAETANAGFCAMTSSISGTSATCSTDVLTNVQGLVDAVGGALAQKKGK